MNPIIIIVVIWCHFVGQIMGSTGVSDKDMDDIVYSFLASSQFMEEEEEEGEEKNKKKSKWKKKNKKKSKRKKGKSKNRKDGNDGGGDAQADSNDTEEDGCPKDECSRE